MALTAAKNVRREKKLFVSGRTVVVQTLSNQPDLYRTAAARYRRIANKDFLVPSLIPVRVGRQGFVLHFLRPDFTPGSHMIGDYAVGRFGWLMQVGSVGYPLRSVAEPDCAHLWLAQPGFLLNVSLAFRAATGATSRIRTDHNFGQPGHEKLVPDGEE
jgi:hypothetical protein